jgi:hypothetical protein
MLRVYLDESGIHAGSEVAVMSGVIAKVDDWLAFEIQWSKYLTDVGAPYFHAVGLDDVEGEHGFLTEPIREYLWRWLPQAIVDHKLGIISTGVLVKDLAYICERNEEFARWFAVPYNFVFEGCLQGATEWSDKHAMGDSIALVFSEQNQYERRALKTYSTYKQHARWQRYLDSITFADMKRVPALQAADLVANQLFHRIGAYYGMNEIGRAGPMNLIGDAGIEIHGGVVARQDMEKCIEEGPAFYFPD